SLDADAKINAILKLGLDEFGMDIAIVSHIEEKKKKYTVLYSQTTGAELAPGTEFDLGVTYCSMTMKLPKALAIPHMKKSEHQRHPCYEAFKLESYLGYTLTRDRRVHGTINFSSPAARDQIPMAHRNLAEQMGEAVNTLLKHKDAA
ncbi:MAG: hypothetical protein AAF653_03505, partial [Chloroflexota bacterium]